jgi:demethylmenaquinone methyltransferase/2-methoxy-6-polyprenyl-1,4-benzoquinol methylase
MHAALEAFEPQGKVLELACGTGNWTRRLVEHATELTAVDASAEMLERCRRKVGDDRVRYVHADVFSWEPDDAYDVVFFSFWLSHVPPARFEDFWNLVKDALAPSGRVFFVDEGRHDYWKEEFVEHEGRHVVTRRLRDGSSYRAVKVFWQAEELEQRLRALGWHVFVRSTGVFYWGHGIPARQDPQHATT